MSGALHVLVVDDQAAIVRFLEVALTNQGCAMTPAASAEEALRLLSEQTYDLVISDIKMPGLSGLDLLRAVKARQPGTPVVLMTGVPALDSAVFGLRHGAFDYLAKPFTLKDVRALVDRIREDRAHARRPALPAGVLEELARRRLGLEALSRLGAAAVEGEDPERFFDAFLADATRSLAGDAAVMLIREPSGEFQARQFGDEQLNRGLIGWLHEICSELMSGDGRAPITAENPTQGVVTIAALIPGRADWSGLLSLARSKRAGGFVPDEQNLFLGYARGLALALSRIRSHRDSEQQLLECLGAFVQAIEAKDPYLKGHSLRVSLYAGELAAAMGLGPDAVTVACRGGMLHDLGKLGVLEPILGKPGPLTPGEHEVIMQHVEVGHRILAPLGFLSAEALVVRHHHERWDGRGYPDGLAGESIPLAARIVATADAFDAMTSDRSYRDAESLEEALAELERGAGTHFDPATVAAFRTIPLDRLREISRFGAPAPSLAAAGG
jgi:response regulator RpfG family c-di-GMP phosphodiesterase